MKFGMEVKESCVSLWWEDVKADYYRVLIKIDGVMTEFTKVCGDTFTTLSLLPFGDNECLIQAVKDNDIIDSSAQFIISVNSIDVICGKNSNEIKAYYNDYPSAQGYRLYVNNGNGFNGEQNFRTHCAQIPYSKNSTYKIKPFAILDNKRVNLGSSEVFTPNDNEFISLSAYKSYGDKIFLSWLYKGRADGFAIFAKGMDKPIFETTDGLKHFTCLKGFKDDVEFVIKAFISTPNGKTFVTESMPISLSERKYEKPLVSLIIPAYNSKDYIARSIDSALASDFENLEIVIVNDGSTDSTQEIIDWYAQNYKNVVALQKQNGGVADTRNVGIAAAKGEYIAFMDNDDLIRPNMISSLYNSIEKNHCDVAIAPLYRLVDRGYTTHCKLPFDTDKAIPMDKYFEIMYTPGFYNCAIWNKLYRASIVKAHPLGILKYEDVSWTPCILSWMKDFCFLNTPFYEWDRKTRPETFGDVLAKMPESELFEHRKQAMLFFVNNGNPERLEQLKVIAQRRLTRYAKYSPKNPAYKRLADEIMGR